MADITEGIERVAPGLANGTLPLPNLVGAGQPSAQQLEQLAAAGYTRVIDLRAPTEERDFDEPSVAKAAGQEYVNIPVEAATLDDAAFDQVRQLLRDPQRPPTVLHCKSANRVGALLLPHLILDQGQSEQAAMDLAQQVGLRDAGMGEAALRYVAHQREQAGR